MINEIVKFCENYPSKLQIKNSSSFSFLINENICFHFYNEIEMKKLIQGLNSKKATGHHFPKTNKISR